MATALGFRQLVCSRMKTLLALQGLRTEQQMWPACRKASLSWCCQTKMERTLQRQVWSIRRRELPHSERSLQTRWRQKLACLLELQRREH